MPEIETNLSAALRLLAHFWLEEVQPSDLGTLAALPGLGETLPSGDAAGCRVLFTELAVEYQRLFGFNLPPYESVYVDPSAMLNAPATQQVQALYGQAVWSPPHGQRAGAPDHLGFELLALADWQEAAILTGIEAGQAAARASSPAARADRLLGAHLVLWVPAFILALQRLSPHPFYAALGELTLGLLLASLPAQVLPAGTDPFPRLPPAPVYIATLETPKMDEDEDEDEIDLESPGQEKSLNALLRRLLTPCEAGLYLTRQDLASLGWALDLPGVVGERAHILRALFEMAGQYELLPKLFAQLELTFADAHSDYAELVEKYPAWAPYASAWQQRLEGTRLFIQSFF